MSPLPNSFSPLFDALLLQQWPGANFIWVARGPFR